MSKPLTNMNNKASEIVDSKFKSLLLAGNWEKCNYQKTEFSQSYNMIEYATTRARYCKAIQNKLVTKGYEYGLWQNARNKDYLNAVQGVVDKVTVEDVDKSDRFKTMFD